MYVGSAEDEKHDQVLDCVMVGPVVQGKFKFVFQVRADVCLHLEATTMPCIRGFYVRVGAGLLGMQERMSQSSSLAHTSSVAALDGQGRPCLSRVADVISTSLAGPIAFARHPGVVC